MKKLIALVGLVLMVGCGATPVEAQPAEPNVCAQVVSPVSECELFVDANGTTKFKGTIQSCSQDINPDSANCAKVNDSSANLFCCRKPPTSPNDCGEPCQSPATTCNGSPKFVPTESGLITKAPNVPNQCVGECIMFSMGVELNHCPQPGTGYVFLCSNPQEAIQDTIKKCAPSAHQDTEGVSFWCCPDNLIE
jgi:hypothetical protein